MKKACTLQKCARTAPPVPPFSCKQIRSNKRKQEETRQPHLSPDLRQVRLNVREREGERKRRKQGCTSSLFPGSERKDQTSPCLSPCSLRRRRPREKKVTLKRREKCGTGAENNLLFLGHF